MIYILSWTAMYKRYINSIIIIIIGQQKASENSFQLTTFKFKENSRTFQGKMEFKDFSRTSAKMQGLFKDLR